MIFDFDGTLCDDFRESISILNRLTDDYRFKKVDTEAIESVREKSAKELISDLGISPHKLPFILRRARKELEAKIEALSPIPGVPEMIKELRAMRVPMGILSSNSSTNIEKFLKRHEIIGFEHIQCGTSLFGKGRLLRKCARHFNVPLHDIIYVGDETRDIEAARDAGTLSLSVTWGFNSRDLLERSRPDFLVNHPEELVHLVPLLPH